MRSRTEDRSHDLAVLRGRRTGGGVSRLLQATSSSWSVRGDTAGTQGGLNLSTVAGIARRPAPLVIVEVHKEGESLPDTAFPPHQVDRLRELADGLRSEVLLTPFSEDVGGVERSVPAAVVDDISPDLEHPQSPHQALVDRTNGQLCQVVHITTQCCSSVAGKLFCARFRLGNHRQGRKRQLVATMHGQFHKRENVGREDEWSSRKLDRCTDVRSTKVRVLHCQRPVPPVSPS